MSQHDMTIDNDTGALVRADIQSALQSLASLSSGASYPTTTYPYMLFADTSDVLYMRNGANTAWIMLPISLSTDNEIGAGSLAPVKIKPAQGLQFTDLTNQTTGWGGAGHVMNRHNTPVVYALSDTVWTDYDELTISVANKRNAHARLVLVDLKIGIPSPSSSSVPIIRVVRDSTTVLHGGTAGAGLTPVTFPFFLNAEAGYQILPFSAMFIDSVGDHSSHEYKIQMINRSTTDRRFFINSPYDQNGFNSTEPTAESSITLVELAGETTVYTEGV